VFSLPLFLFRQREKAAEKEKLKKKRGIGEKITYLLKVLWGCTLSFMKGCVLSINSSK
jgi:hypothetical protein